MGKLAGFRYRDIVESIRAFGFMFEKHAASSHEIWYNKHTDKYITIPNCPGDMPEGTLQAILREV